MHLTPVKSSNIAAAGYDPRSRELQIRFTNGALHAYDDVPAATYSAVLSAPSVGKFFAANVRGKFTSRKVSP